MNTLFTGRKIIELEQVDSTNTYALELLKTTTLPEGTWITARHQEQGRGQRGNNWESEPGLNITASLVLYPVFLPVEKQFLLSKAVALALHDLLKMYLPLPREIRIKWPNDIYAGPWKIAGILIENILRQGRLHASVAGIGINVNQDYFSTEAYRAVSMKQLCGKVFDLGELLGRLSEQLEARYLQLRAGHYQHLNACYHDVLYRINAATHYLINGKPAFGTITGVSDSGMLQMRLEKEGEKEFDLKQVRFL
jgi:BirA family biotin operon repressor/biotin-[acetyl-CoA-carboxylase] ligase